MSESTAKKVGTLAREVAVIVLGVSIALGADAAYDRHQDALERVRILQSVRADLELDSVAFVAGLRGAGQAVEATSRLLALVDSSSEIVEDGVSLRAALRESVIFPSGLKESATYREITATGRISLIADADLRESLLRYYARSFTGLGPEIWATFFSDVSGAYERSLRRRLGPRYLDLMRCSPAAPDYETCLRSIPDPIDPRPLTADPDFVERLVAMTLWAERFQRLIARESELHQRLMADVHRTIGEQ